MNVYKTAIDGVVIIDPRVFEDARGIAILSETAVFQYKCGEFYHPEADGINYFIAKLQKKQ